MPLKDIKPSPSSEALNAYYKKKITYTDFLFWEIILIVIALAFVASIFQSLGQNTSWYQSLPIPSWQPPDWAFGLIWIIMYLLISLTGYSGIKADPRRIVFGGLFVIGLLLNVLWTIVFTYQQNITGGFIIIIILDVVVLTQIIYLLTCKNKPARVTGGLLVIYLIWLAYATSLNGSIMLNQ